MLASFRKLDARTLSAAAAVASGPKLNCQLQTSFVLLLLSLLLFQTRPLIILNFFANVCLKN